MLSISSVAVNNYAGLGCAQFDAANQRGREMDTSDCLPITTSVPEYGLIALDLQRSGSYEAAKAGVFPVIEVQGKKRVPVRAALRKLAGDDPEVLKAVASDFASKFLRLKGETA
jgi:hypothetical protein